MSISETELKMIEASAKNLDIQDIGLFWQLTIKTIDVLRIVGIENLTLEMYITQLVHLKNLHEKSETTNPNQISKNKSEDLLGKEIKETKIDSKATNQVKNQLKSTDQIKANPVKTLSTDPGGSKIEITSFQDLITKADKDKEIELKYDLERNVKLVSFNWGKIDISFNDKLNKNFIKTLTEKLLQWTGERWIISLSKIIMLKAFTRKT